MRETIRTIIEEDPIKSEKAKADSNDEYYECGQCPAYYTSLPEFEEHFRSHKPNWKQEPKLFSKDPSEELMEEETEVLEDDTLIEDIEQFDDVIGDELETTDNEKIRTVIIGNGYY